MPTPPYTPRIIDAADVPAGWLPLEAAIVAYGKSERTLRRLLTVGDIEAVKVQGPFGLQWRIAPPSTDAPASSHGAPSTDQALAQAGQIIQAFQRERDDMKAERDALRAQLDQQQAARLADAEELGRLRGRLETIEAELERARSLPSNVANPAEQFSPNNPPTHPPASAVPRRRWPWQR